MSEEVTSVAESVSLGLAPARRKTPAISLKRLVVATITNDALSKPLLGIRPNVDDPRVYAYYQPTATVDTDRPAFITYAQTGWPERTQAVGNPVLNLAIWGLNWETVEGLRARMEALFDDKDLVTAEGRAVHTDVILMHDNYQENTKFASVVVQVRFGFSQV